MYFRNNFLAAALLFAAILAGPSGELQATPLSNAVWHPGEPLRLIGQSEGEVRRLLGRPLRIENNGPSKTLHYKLGECSVQLDLFVNVTTRRYDVLWQRIDGSETDKRRCGALVRP